MTHRDRPVRTMVAWVPDWPLVAAGVPADRPAATFRANRVVAGTAAARRAGVRRGMRRRQAQGRCPELLVLDHDPEQDARVFEPVVRSIEGLTPRVEVGRPGQCAFPTLGPSRYHGGDDALARLVVDTVTRALADLLAVPMPVAGGFVGEPVAPPSVAVGVAEGCFAAGLAARRALRDAGVGGHTIRVVPPGGTAAFLAPLPLGSLEFPDLVDLLGRLGLRTLGDLAALPISDVLGRFGPEGATAHRMASGMAVQPPNLVEPSADFAGRMRLDPPVDEVAPVAFAARTLAEEVHGGLAARGTACTRIRVVLETEHGEVSERLWRHEGALGSAAIADRVRWQVDGWLRASSQHRPTAGIVRLELHPDELVPATGRQLGFWGGPAAADGRAGRAIARIGGLLGPDAVVVPERAGGREPIEQLRLVPAGATDLEAEHRALVGTATEPWPGRLPRPSPATVHGQPVPVDVLDGRGGAVVIDGRCTLLADPAELRLHGRRAGERRLAIREWAGPWPVDERWWDDDRWSRRVRFQVVTEDGVARLLTCAAGRWWQTAVYD